MEGKGKGLFPVEGLKIEFIWIGAI
jgi:hypothetical protein